MRGWGRRQWECRGCGLTYCTAEESQRALAGEGGAFGMVGAAHVAIEAVAGGVGEELLLGVRRGDRLPLLERDAGVLLRSDVRRVGEECCITFRSRLSTSL